MPETRPIRSFGELRPGDDRHPYLTARGLRIDASLRRQRLLQVLAGAVAGLSLALGLAVLGLLQAREGQRVVPYLVRTGDDGSVAGVEPLVEPAEPTEAMVRHALGLFVVNARTVTTDETAQRRLILRAYDYAAGRAVGYLNDHYRAHPPFARAGRPDGTTVTPVLTSLLYLSERDVYEVLWVEEVRDLNGGLVERETWRALLTVTVEPPEAVEEALVNPLGIKVADLDWTRLAPTSDS